MINTPIIISNTKAYIKSIKDFYKLQNEIWINLEKETYKYYVAVPSSLISLIKREEYKAFDVGAQNYSASENGAHTGTDTLSNVLEAGVEFLILGHSEVRERGESSFEISKKVSESLYSKTKTVLCIGEKERKIISDKHEYTFADEIIKMLNDSLTSVNKNDVHNLVIAYEPVWAIGSNTPATPSIVMEAVIIIRRELSRKFGIDAAKKIKIIYGGSVDDTNAVEYIKGATCDGVLVGRSSTDAKVFAKLINNIYANK
jgi:triosephosphate isomerase